MAIKDAATNAEITYDAVYSLPASMCVKSEGDKCYFVLPDGQNHAFCLINNEAKNARQYRRIKNDDPNEPDVYEIRIPQHARKIYSYDETTRDVSQTGEWMATDEIQAALDKCALAKKSKEDALRAQLMEEEDEEELQKGKRKKEEPKEEPKEEVEETTEDSKECVTLDETHSVYTHDPSLPWETIRIPKEAMQCAWEDRVAFRMPDGKYGQYKFNILTSNLCDKGDYYEVMYRTDLPCAIIGGEKGNIRISADEFGREFKGNPKFKKTFMNKGIPIMKKIKTKGPDGKTRYLSRDEYIDNKVDSELKNNKHWVVTLDTQVSQKDINGGEVTKWEHRFIDPATGEEADINNPDTWGTYDDAMAWAKMCGGASLAYAVDGSDGICAVTEGTLHGDKKPAGKRSATFYKNAGELKDDLSSVSDGETRLFRRGSFVDVRGIDSGLKDMSDKDNQQELRETFKVRVKESPEERDRKARAAISRAEKSKLPQANSFIALYRGNGNPKRSYRKNQQVLMDGAAFWCDNDLGAMMDVMASSKYFDSKKPKEYYETMAKKAIERCSYGWSDRRAQKEEKSAQKAFDREYKKQDDKYKER